MYFFHHVIAYCGVCSGPVNTYWCTQIQEAKNTVGTGDKTNRVRWIEIFTDLATKAIARIWTVVERTLDWALMSSPSDSILLSKQIRFSTSDCLLGLEETQLSDWDQGESICSWWETMQHLLYISKGSDFMLNFACLWLLIFKVLVSVRMPNFTPFCIPVRWFWIFRIYCFQFSFFGTWDRTRDLMLARQLLVPLG